MFGVRYSTCWLLLATLAFAAEPESPAQEVRYRAGLETIEITADEAPVELAGQEIARVPKGRWFGVRERKGDLVGIHVFSGTNLRIGYVHSRDVRALTDADVDLPAEAIRIAQRFNPELDAKALRARLDALADRTAKAAAGGTNGMAKAARIARVLYAEEGFRYQQDYHSIESSLNEKQGNCLGLSLVYLCAAGKLGLPFRMLSVPRHALVRYDDGRERFNVEPSMGGMLLTEDAYLLTHYGKLCSIYPRVLPHAQAVGVLLADAGAELANQRKETAALDCFFRAIEINPQHPEGYYNWGVTLLVQKKRMLACNKFQEAIRIDPYFAAAYYNLGLAMAGLGDPKGACGMFAKATEISPRCAEAYFNWGIVLLSQGKRFDAIEKFGKVESLAPHLRPLVAQILQSPGTPSVIDLSISPSPQGNPQTAGDLLIDEKARTVTAAATFAKQGMYDVLKGALEYVITAKGGKSYETVFILDCTPEALHQALLRVGFQPGEPSREGDPPRGQGVLITAEYEADGKKVRRPVDEFLVSTKTNQPLTPGPWVFTGSAKGVDPATNQETLQAYQSKNLVGLHWADATPLLQNPRLECKQQNIYKANLPALAKAGTPVRLIFAPLRAPVPEGAKRVHVFVTGRVQGVGFRNFTEREARVLGLTGFVKNLPDGRVEAIVEGPAEKVRALLEKLKVGPRAARVEKLDAQDEPPAGDFAQFEVRF